LKSTPKLTFVTSTGDFASDYLDREAWLDEHNIAILQHKDDRWSVTFYGINDISLDNLTKIVTDFNRFAANDTSKRNNDG
jgi:hypothetical protein